MGRSEDCNGCKDCECNGCMDCDGSGCNCKENENHVSVQGNKKVIKLKIIMMLILTFTCGIILREAFNLRARLNEAVHENLELKQMITSDEIKDIENMDVSQGMDMEKFIKFNELYLQYFDNSHGEVYLRRIKNEEVVVLKLKEALENEKDSENQKMIKESLNVHNEILDSDKEKYDNWNKLERDYPN